MRATTTGIPTDDGFLPGMLWLPEGADRPVPGLVVLQEIFGLSSYVQQRCADLAHLGYAVLAPQLYARLDPPLAQIPDSADGDVEAWLNRGMQCAQDLDFERASADVLAAFDALRGLDDVDAAATGLLGFCYGGGLAFAATAAAASAGRPPAVLVSFYGSALPTLLPLADDVTVPSLHVFGTADAYIPRERVEEIRRAVTDEGRRPQIRFELHEGAGHAFDNPHPALHDATASAAAWRQTVQFLSEELPAAR